MFFTEKKFTKVLDKYNYNFKTNDIIAGTIFSQEHEGYLVDIGNNKAAYLPKAEILLSNKNDPNINIHDTREFFILVNDIETNQLILSLKRLKYIRAWDRIKQMKEEDIIVKAYVKGVNKGGILIEIEDIQGFIPNSHICYGKSKNQLYNTFISCKFLIANEYNNQLVLSNRCAVITNIIDKYNLKVGSIIISKIIKLTDFGIFFNIYNIPALMHKSEISSYYNNNTDNIFEVGKELPIQIRHLDIKQGRISISMTNIKN
uniref:Ribosomal protein S1 n=1 Tax=Dichotomaria marginata TaxID=268567 RepID=A0A1G4NSQ2_9FLOR|nr:Ribosomal protein S1 [Dichotomaria marginata]SCW21645.1 Ribosomal protein S1 [Dichotomaria marginata]